MGESRKTRRQASGEGSNRLRSGPMGQVKDLKKLVIGLSKAVKICQPKICTQPAQLHTSFSMHLTNHRVLPTAKKCLLVLTEDLPSYMTLASRIGSMGGLVACANSCEK